MALTTECEFEVELSSAKDHQVCHEKHLQTNAGEPLLLTINIGKYGAAKKLVAVWKCNKQIIPHRRNYYEYGTQGERITFKILRTGNSDAGAWTAELYDLNKLESRSRLPVAITCFLKVNPRGQKPGPDLVVTKGHSNGGPVALGVKKSAGEKPNPGGKSLSSAEGPRGGPAVNCDGFSRSKGSLRSVVAVEKAINKDCSEIKRRGASWQSVGETAGKDVQQRVIEKRNVSGKEVVGTNYARELKKRPTEALKSTINKANTVQVSNKSLGARAGVKVTKSDRTINPVVNGGCNELTAANTLNASSKGTKELETSNKKAPSRSTCDEVRTEILIKGQQQIKGQSQSVKYNLVNCSAGRTNKAPAVKTCSTSETVVSSAPTRQKGRLGVFKVLAKESSFVKPAAGERDENGNETILRAKPVNPREGKRRSWDTSKPVANEGTRRIVSETDHFRQDKPRINAVALKRKDSNAKPVVKLGLSPESTAYQIMAEVKNEPDKKMAAKSKSYDSCSRNPQREKSSQSQADERLVGNRQEKSDLQPSPEARKVPGRNEVRAKLKIFDRGNTASVESQLRVNDTRVAACHAGNHSPGTKELPNTKHGKGTLVHKTTDMFLAERVRGSVQARIQAFTAKVTQEVDSGGKGDNVQSSWKKGLKSPTSRRNSDQEAVSRVSGVKFEKREVKSFILPKSAPVTSASQPEQIEEKAGGISQLSLSFGEKEDDGESTKSSFQMHRGSDSRKLNGPETKVTDRDEGNAEGKRRDGGIASVEEKAGESSEMKGVKEHKKEVDLKVGREEEGESEQSPRIHAETTLMQKTRADHATREQSPVAREERSGASDSKFRRAGIDSVDRKVKVEPEHRQETMSKVKKAILEINDGSHDSGATCATDGDKFVNIKKRCTATAAEGPSTLRTRVASSSSKVSALIDRFRKNKEGEETGGKAMPAPRETSTIVHHVPLATASPAFVKKAEDDSSCEIIPQDERSARRTSDEDRVIDDDESAEVDGGDLDSENVFDTDLQGLSSYVRREDWGNLCHLSGTEGDLALETHQTDSVSSVDEVVNAAEQSRFVQHIQEASQAQEKHYGRKYEEDEGDEDAVFATAAVQDKRAEVFQDSETFGGTTKTSAASDDKEPEEHDKEPAPSSQVESLGRQLVAGNEKKIAEENFICLIPPQSQTCPSLSSGPFSFKAPDQTDRTDIVGKLGERIELDVGSWISDGESDGGVQWKLPNRKIELGERKLVLENLCFAHSGKYEADFTLPQGSRAKKIFSVNVEGPPDVIIGLTARKIDDDNIEVSWNGCSFDGGSNVLHYILRHGDRENQTCELSCRVSAKSSSSNDNFMVAAVNKHGRGPWTCIEYQDCITIQEEGFHEYTKLEELGKGRFGHVFKVEQGGKFYAGKFIKCIRAVDREKARQEVKILSLLRGHDKLLQIIAAFQQNREVIILTELLSGGELFERIVDDDFNLTESKCGEFVQEILQGIEFVHRKSIVHLDVKPENILITPTGLKIIDFGLSQIYDPNNKQCVLFGTPEFVSPEIINYEPIGFYCDIWSVGVLTYVLVSGLSPFMGNNDSETFSNVTRGEFDFDDEAFDQVSQECLNFIRGCLTIPCTNRMSCDDCLKHPWMELNSDAKIRKDKLKSFVLRRKWQKTGNAIRAIGRLRSYGSSSSAHED